MDIRGVYPVVSKEVKGSGTHMLWGVSDKSERGLWESSGD